MKFPDTFVWGAAASSYQIEGAACHAGGGLSIWDMLGRQPGRIANGDTGDIACDHYHRYPHDLMARIGLQAYRFSVSWPRVLPQGIGAVNQAGLDFYDSLVDALLEKNIDPWITLFHWDFPYDLYCRGGWLNRDSADWFADYTGIVVDRLSDRVSHWCTLNEPQVYIQLGHVEGRHAPGLQMGMREALLAGHHTLLAHGKAVQAIRQNSKQRAWVGATNTGSYYMPDSDREVDIEAARKRNFDFVGRHFFNNTWFADPMLLGRYPEDGVELFAADMPPIAEDDLQTICQPLDYFGANIYFGHYGRAGSDGEFEETDKPDLAHTEMGWPITPEVLYWGPRFYYERYGLPVVITENGMAGADVDDADHIDDEKRIRFHHAYLSALARAVEDGVPCAGYLLWSIMDNFEWAEGYAKRFGLVYVDYASQRRKLKNSAYWYSHVIAGNRLHDDRPLELACAGTEVATGLKRESA